jgi:YfiR/HmsC-like
MKQARRRVIDPRAACALVTTWLLAGASIPASWSAQGPVAAESVKAAFLFRFGEYVDWPLPPGPGPIVIAVLGEPAVAEELRRILPGRTLRGQAVVVHELATVQDLESPDILYIGARTRGSLTHIIDAARRGGRPMLVVTDDPGGLEAGAAINFVASDDRIRFEVSPSAAAATGIRLSSRLFGVAVRVVGPRLLPAQAPSP